jgi:hypothetical protein
MTVFRNIASLPAARPLSLVFGDKTDAASDDVEFRDWSVPI